MEYLGKKIHDTQLFKNFVFQLDDVNEKNLILKDTDHECRTTFNTHRRSKGLWWDLSNHGTSRETHYFFWNVIRGIKDTSFYFLCLHISHVPC